MPYGLARGGEVRYDECLNTVLLMELGKMNRLGGKVKGSCSNVPCGRAILQINIPADICI